MESNQFADVLGKKSVAEQLKRALPASYEAAESFWQSAQQAPALSPRMKALVQVALHATVTSLDREETQRRIRHALAVGATAQDVLDVLLTIVGVANHALYFAVPVLMRELEAAGHADAGLPPMTPDAQKAKEAFVQARGFWNEQRDLIVRLMPEYFSALSRLSAEPWKNGSLTDKERELVCIAIDCTVTHMYEPGLAMHIRHALRKGARRDEILEVFHLAALTGLDGYIVGAQTLYGEPAPR